MENVNNNNQSANSGSNWKDCCKGNKGWKIAGVIVLILIVASILGCDAHEGWAGGNDEMPNTITVTGKGEVVVKPDIATVSFGVTAENLDVAKAQNESATKINNIIDFLKKNGVDEKDIKTTNYSLYPRYDYTNSSIYPYNGRQILAAYVVSQTVEVKVRDIAKAGILLTGVGEFGVTDVSGLNFSVDNIDEVRIDAREAAIKDAREQAKVLADQLGVRLDDIVSFSEGGNYPMPMYYGLEKSMSAGMGGDMVAPALPVGENKITSNVTITYEIED